VERRLNGGGTEVLGGYQREGLGRVDLDEERPLKLTNRQLPRNTRNYRQITTFWGGIFQVFRGLKHRF